MDPKIYLICFADSRLKRSVSRIKSEIKDFTVIDNTFFFSEQDLSPSFKKEFHPIRHRRGYGYWKWKPYLVKSMLGKIEDGDILMWSDVGNMFNTKGKDRFMEYIKMARENETGIVAFSQTGNLERTWTKGDLFYHLNVYNNLHFTDTFQIWAGAFILGKTPSSIELVNRWFDIHSNYYDLTTDKRSKTPNLEGFIEHRHDQSVFSLLVKSYNSALINSNEVYAGEGGWEAQHSFPIWGCRKKDFNQNKLLKALLSPYKYLSRKYLTYFERMDINKDFEW